MSCLWPQPITSTAEQRGERWLPLTCSSSLQLAGAFQVGALCGVSCQWISSVALRFGLWVIYITQCNLNRLRKPLTGRKFYSKSPISKKSSSSICSRNVTHLTAKNKRVHWELPQRDWVQCGFPLFKRNFNGIRRIIQVVNGMLLSRRSGISLAKWDLRCTGQKGAQKVSVAGCACRSVHPLFSPGKPPGSRSS